MEVEAALSIAEEYAVSKVAVEQRAQLLEEQLSSAQAELDELKAQLQSSKVKFASIQQEFATVNSLKRAAESASRFHCIYVGSRNSNSPISALCVPNCQLLNLSTLNCHFRSI